MNFTVRDNTYINSNLLSTSPLIMIFKKNVTRKIWMYYYYTRSSVSARIRYFTFGSNDVTCCSDSFTTTLSKVIMLYVH
jgi:hypothetical protein